MKNMWYAIVASVLLNSAVCLQAKEVHVVPMAEQNGEWGMLLGVPSQQKKWRTFSATVTSGQDPMKKAKEMFKEKTYGFYELPENPITRKTSDDIFYFFKVNHIPQKKLNDHAAKALTRPIEAFAWVLEKEIAEESEPFVLESEKSGVTEDMPIDIEYLIQKQTFENLKQYVPGVIKEMKETLSGSLNELKNSLNALKTALRQK